MSEQINQDKAGERIVGLDALRIIAMFFIVLGHVVRFSFNYNDPALAHTSIEYILMDSITILVLVGVDVYAMLSGYLMCRRPPHYSKLLPLWLQLCFISLLFACSAKLLHIDMVERPLWKYALPVSQNLWWYMTAYFGMYPLLIFINKALQGMNKREIIWGGQHYFLLIRHIHV